MIRVKTVLVAGLVVACLSTTAVFADDSDVQHGMDQERKGDYDGAITTYKRAMQEEQSQGSLSAAEMLFKLYHKLKRYDDAIQLMQDIISKKRDPFYLELLADTYRAAGNFYSAQHIYEDLYNTNPANDRAMFYSAMCLEATGSYDAARDLFKKVVEKGGDFAPRATQELERAEGESQVTSIDPDTEIGRWPKSKPVKIYVADGSGQPGYTPQLRNYMLRAIADWQNVLHDLLKLEVVSDRKDAQIVVGFTPRLEGALGVTYPHGDDYGNLDKATIQIACNTDSRGRTLPSESSATRTLYESRDRQVREVCLHEMGHALGLNHSQRSDDIMANGIYGLHSADVVSERQLAVGDIERITQLYTAPEAKQGEDQKAALVAAVQKVVAKLQSDGGGAAGGSGGVSTPVAMRGGNPYVKSEAVAKPDPHTTAMQQAIFALQGGKAQECIDILKDVLKANPRNAQAHYIKAVACVNMRNYPEAQKEYQQVLTLVPSGKLADLANAGLAKIKK